MTRREDRDKHGPTLRRGVISHVKIGRFTLDEYAIYMTLIPLADFESGVWLGSSTTLSGWFQTDRNQTGKAMRGLREKGYIHYPRIERRRGEIPVVVIGHERPDGSRVSVSDALELVAGWLSENALLESQPSPSGTPATPQPRPSEGAAKAQPRRSDAPVDGAGAGSETDPIRRTERAQAAHGRRSDEAALNAVQESDCVPSENDARRSDGAQTAQPRPSEGAANRLHSHASARGTKNETLNPDHVGPVAGKPRRPAPDGGWRSAFEGTVAALQPDLQQLIATCLPMWQQSTKPRWSWERAVEIARQWAKLPPAQVAAGLRQFASPRIGHGGVELPSHLSEGKGIGYAHAIVQAAPPRPANGNGSVRPSNGNGKRPIPSFECQEPSCKHKHYILDATGMFCPDCGGFVSGERCPNRIKITAEEFNAHA